ncbi:MAG: ABC transporter permease [Chlorobiaceae bacterium]|nr:ABC transporter permease [Chlorobiaceae bacterium]
MKTGLWIARRFSFARKRFRIINVISAISLAGIVIGVSTLLVVMSVLNGFQKLARDLFITIDSPAQLVPLHGRSFAVSDSLLHSIRSIEGVASAEPFAEGEAIMATRDKSELVMVKGLSDTAHKRLIRQTRAGHPYFSDETIAVGELLAWRTNIEAFKMVKIFSPELISFGLESLSEPYMMPVLTIPEARVSSLFSLQKIFDDRYVLTSNRFAEKILLLGQGLSSGVDIRAEDGVSNDAFISALREWLDRSPINKSCRIRSLEEKYSSVFAVMKLEKWVSFGVLMLIILVASLSLTGALAMTAIDKQRELFYLRCLGLEKPQFMAIFIIQGAMTGVIGTAAGVVIAWSICTLQELFGIVKLPSKSAFIIDAYPVSMQLNDFIAVSILAILLCIAVSLYPARKAALIATSRSLDLKTN